MRGEGQLLKRHAQPGGFQRNIGQRFAPAQNINGHGRVGQAVILGADQGTDNARGRSRVGLGPAPAGQQGGGVEIGAEFIELHRHDILVADAQSAQRENAGGDEAGDGIGPALGQHGLAQGRRHGNPVHPAAIKAGGAGEGGEELPPGIGIRRGDGLTDEVRRAGDILALEGHHGERRRIIDQEGAEKVHIRPFQLHADHRVHIGHADIKGAAGDLHRHIARAKTALHGDIQPLPPKMPPLERHQKGGLRPLKRPIRRKANIGKGLAMHGRRSHGCDGQGKGSTAVHGALLRA